MNSEDKVDATTMKLVLHKNLKKLLDERGMTASQLSRATKVPNSTIQNWLSGLVPRNLIQLKRVAEYFEASVDFLLYGEKEFESSKSSFKEYENGPFRTHPLHFIPET